MTTANLIEIFCLMDEFCKNLKPVLKKRMVENPGKRRRNRPCKMSDSEVMTILVLFHLMRHRDLKTFYLGYVCNHIREDFPNRLSYNRFVERRASVAVHLLLFLQTCALGKYTGISIIGSTPLAACHIKRERAHKMMKGWATKANAQWVGSMASSCTLSSTTGARPYSGCRHLATWTAGNRSRIPRSPGNFSASCLPTGGISAKTSLKNFLLTTYTLSPGSKRT